MELKQIHRIIAGIKKTVKDVVFSTKEKTKEKASELFSHNRVRLKKVAMGIMVLSLFSVTTGVYKSVQGYRVTFNGEELGMVREMDDFTQGLNLVQENLKAENNMAITLDNNVTFERAMINKDQLLETPVEAAQAIEAKAVSLTAQGSVIVIEGQDVVALASEDEAKKVLESVIASYAQLGENEVIASEPVIQQKYEIVSRVIPYSTIRKTEDAVNYIMHGTDEVIQYQVQPGDTSWNIAVNRGMSIESLASANPDKNLEKLKPGEVVQLTETKPFLDVEVVKETKYTEQIPFQTTYQSDATVYVGKTKELQPGVYGLKEVTALVTYKNGTQVAKQITAENQLKQPVNQIIAKGTMPLPPAQGSGSFRIPTSGRVTAINKAGAHAGSRAVDIANSTGTPIYASDSGRVTKAGWNSGYGYTVIISHGNGFTTLYGHLSSISVTVGQNVSRGERIASMGSTGNSTGPHLHFEILKNGTRQVITNYFSNLRVGGRVSP